jgi:MoaA/NifB/PqqE/SkfB family radical SAM enzyme
VPKRQQVRSALIMIADTKLNPFGRLSKSISSFLASVGRLFGTRRIKADFLYLEVTHLCNLRCIACYTGAGEEKHDALTLDEQKSVVRQAKDLGARIVSLSGSGEPLLHRHLFELIDYIRQLGMDVVVFTNGTVIDKETAAFLVSRSVFVYFKLYSLDRDVFDRMVGRKDAYQWVDYSYWHDGTRRTLRIPSGLKCLLDARKTPDDSGLVRIESLITRLNAETLPQVARFCKACGLGLYLETPVFKGRAIENYAEIALNEGGYRELYERLEQILGCEYMQQIRDCRCPVEKNPVVLTNGDVGFCSSRQARVGNVRNSPLKRLYAKARKLKRREDRLIAGQWQQSKFFRTCRARQYYQAMHNLPCDY